MIMILIIIILFQEDNIFGTDASLTYGPLLTNIDMLNIYRVLICILLTINLKNQPLTPLIDKIFSVYLVVAATPLYQI